MKLEVNFTPLENVCRAMGARPIMWTSTLRAMATPEFDVALRTTGVEIQLHEVNVAGPGLLVYMEEQVILYIKDTRQEVDTLLHDPEKAKKFHVSDCKTLAEMRRQNRYERYVVTTRKDGLFLVDAYDYEKNTVQGLEAPLPVCRNCLRNLDYKGYEFASFAKKKQLWKEFSIEEFFTYFSARFKTRPRYSDITAPPPEYTPDWGVVSQRARVASGWRCQRCKVNLSAQKNLLHVHHRNGVRADNRPSNLEVLCVLCHSAQPSHHHMRVSAADRLAIERLRREQGR